LHQDRCTEWCLLLDSPVIDLTSVNNSDDNDDDDDDDLNNDKQDANSYSMYTYKYNRNTY